MKNKQTRKFDENINRSLRDAFVWMGRGGFLQKITLNSHSHDKRN